MKTIFMRLLMPGFVCCMVANSHAGATLKIRAGDSSYGRVILSVEGSRVWLGDSSNHLQTAWRGGVEPGQFHAQVVVAGELTCA